MFNLIEDLDSAWADVLRAWHGLDFSQGWRPEIVAGGIFMTPPPGTTHNLIADELHYAVGSVIDRRRFAVFQSQGVALRSVSGIFIPDLCVVARSQAQPGTGFVDSDHVVLTVEITSMGNADHDRKLKKWAYAHGGVAQYVLVDAFDQAGPSVWVFSQPEDGVYRDAVRTPFGERIALADPVAADIDTSLFPAS